MRISTLQMQNNGLNGILDRQSELSKTQQQLATGKRVLNPSDDVNATTQALALNKVIATHEQYQRNADSAISRLKQEEISLTNATDILQRIHELAIQDANPLLDATSRKSMAAEARVLLDQMIGLANSQDSEGEYIFSGYNVGTAPITATENPGGSGLYDYAYTGDAGQRNIQLSANRQIEVGDPGQDVFMDVPLSGGGTQSIFETLEQFALDLEANNTPNSVVPADMQVAIDHLGTFISKSGARQTAIEGQQQFNEDVVLQSKTTLSEVQDLDYAEAISRLNLHMVSLEASQQSFSKIQNLSLFNFL